MRYMDAQLGTWSQTHGARYPVNGPKPKGCEALRAKKFTYFSSSVYTNLCNHHVWLL